MVQELSQLLSAHQLNYLILALSVCTVTAVLLSILSQLSFQPKEPENTWRGVYVISFATICGMGTWTSHFVAILGYRADIDFSYDAFDTFVSAGLAILVVGVPLAYATQQRNSLKRAIAGAVSGLGIWLMHETGMQALGGCIRETPAVGNYVAAFVGCTGVAAAVSIRDRFSGALFACLFALSVVTTHSIAIGFTNLSPSSIVGPGLYSDNEIAILTSLTSAMLICAFVIVVYAIYVSLRQNRINSEETRTALNSMSNGLLSFDRDLRLKLFNERYTEFFDLRPNALHPGMTFSQIIEAVGSVNGWPLRRIIDAKEMAETLLVAPPHQPLIFSTDNGRVIKLNISATDDGDIVLTYNDISTEQEAKRLAHRLAFLDDLTGLPNRRLMSSAIEKLYEEDQEFNLMLIDLDHFRHLNDAYGHATCDKLLSSVAQRLLEFNEKEVELSGAAVARIAGDEFGIIASMHPQNSLKIAQDLSDVLKAPYIIDGTEIVVTSSVGIGDSTDATSTEQLFENASFALSEAKKSGGKCIRTLDTVLQKKYLANIRIEEDLPLAIEQGQFWLAYQPIFELKNLQVLGFEALIRWNHPDAGAISPAEFIPVAESAGLIGDIGKWILIRACLDAVQFPSTTYIAVNVSPKQFQSGQLFDDVVNALRISGLSPDRLELELTETAIVDDTKLIAETLQKLRAIGVKVAVDDFGTGFSSLSYLKDYPLDRIKIDRSFVITAENDNNAMAILRGLAVIAAEMGVSILAEGVETDAQLSLVRTLRCDAVQGFLLGKPKSFNQVMRSLEVKLTPAYRAAS